MSCDLLKQLLALTVVSTLFALPIFWHFFCQSSDPTEIGVAVDALKKTYQFAHAQSSSANPPLKNTVAIYVNSMRTKFSSARSTQQPSPQANEGKPEFISNGTLRACVIKAQCSLMIAIIYIYHESSKQYIQASFNLRKGKSVPAYKQVFLTLKHAAYKNFQLVWEEYQRMGNDSSNLLDPNTLSGLQFG